jgi:hypothetical protein
MPKIVENKLKLDPVFFRLLRKHGIQPSRRIFINDERQARNQKRTFAQKDELLAFTRTQPADQHPNSLVAGKEKLLGFGAAVPGAGRSERNDSYERLLIPEIARRSQENEIAVYR